MELQRIRKFAAWNGYPKNVANGIINRVSSKRKQPTSNKTDVDEESIPMVFLNLNYAGGQGELLVNNCFKKLRRCLNANVKLVPKYTVTKLSYFTNMKDKLNKLDKSSVVYNFTCPGCKSSYIGKTDRTLFVRTKEHATRKDSAISNHLDSCPDVKHIFDLFNTLENDVDSKEFRFNTVRDNTTIIDQSSNWNVLLFKEAFHIKEKSPILNNGVRAPPG